MVFVCVCICSEMYCSSIHQPFRAPFVVSKNVQSIQHLRESVYLFTPEKKEHAESTEKRRGREREKMQYF